jgi:DNA-directed RNA polymerase specialized sigma24 family protein
MPQPHDAPSETSSPARAAIDALSDTQVKMLRGYARWMMGGLGRKVQHSDAEDLYNEAMIRALDDPNWNPVETSMFHRLLAHIYNITRKWSQERNRYSDSEIPEVPGLGNNVHNEVYEAMTLEAMKRRLRTHVVASAVLDTILNHEKPAEAIETLGISMKAYAAARRRIFRQADKLLNPSSGRPRP